MDTKKWFEENTRQPRVTDEVIAAILQVSRKTANKRINAGLPMDDIVTISRALEVNPVTALVELGHLNHNEVEDYLDSDGQLVDTAEDGVLALELARRLNPATKANVIDEIARRRSSNTPGNSRPDSRHDGTVRTFPYPGGAFAADSSIDEQKAREDEGSDPID